MNRVDRLMAYLLLLQSRGLVRAQDFARHFEISERTVYRDIQALCETGVPISAVPGEGYRLMEGYYLPPVAFSPQEARAIFLAVSMLDGFTAAGETKTAVLSALEKVRAVLPKTTLRQMEALQAVVRFYAFPAPPLNFDDPLFLRLQEAIHQQKVVHLHYRALNSSKTTEREVEPLRLVFFDKTWMLSGFCRLRQDVRTFRLDRMEKVTISQEQFAHRLLFQPATPEETIQIVVQFENDVVRWVREQQHFSFVKEETADSSHTLMHYQIRSVEQILSWLLSWGDKMMVLQPDGLRARIRETAVHLLTRHTAEIPQLPERIDR